MYKLRAGIIGGGFIGAQHVEALRRLGDVEVMAIASSNLARAQASAEALHIPQAYASYVELLADPEIDVIHTCTPNVLHYAINRAALESGKHVVSEKPLAMNAAETASLVEIAQHSGRLAAVNFNHRGYPMVQQARAMVAHGQIGAVWLVHGAYLQDWLLYPNDWNWRLDPAEGGNSRAVADIGSHWADLVQHVIGQHIVRVCADLQTLLPRRVRPVGPVQSFSGAQDAHGAEVDIATEDYAAVMFTTEGGVHGVFRVSQVSAGHKNDLVFEVNGAQASLRWDADSSDELWVGHRNQANQRITKDPSLVAPGVRAYTHLPGGHHEAWPDALKNVFGEIYAAIRAGRSGPGPNDAFASFSDGHRSALLVDAILESSRRGAWVDLS